MKKQAFKTKNRSPKMKKQAFMDMLAGLELSTPTKENMLDLFQSFGFNVAFSRLDVMHVTGITASPATELMRKMKKAELIVSAKGRGKYTFAMPKV